jgi:hypothetical protein
MSNITVSLGTTNRILIEVPVSVETGSYPKGSFAVPDTSVKYNGIEQEVVNGFIMEYPNVGTLEPSTGECLGVIYTHNDPTKSNRIYFISSDYRMSSVDIVNVPVHDHASITQGGPAHGTYSSEVDLQE